MNFSSEISYKSSAEDIIIYMMINYIEFLDKKL